MCYTNVIMGFGNESEIFYVMLDKSTSYTDRPMWLNLAKIVIYGCLTVFGQKLTWEEIGKCSDHRFRIGRPCTYCTSRLVVSQASGLKCPSSVTGDNLANTSWIKSPEPITCQRGLPAKMDLLSRRLDISGTFSGSTCSPDEQEYYTQLHNTSWIKSPEPITCQRRGLPAKMTY